MFEIDTHIYIDTCKISPFTRLGSADTKHLLHSKIFKLKCFPRIVIPS